MPSKLRKSGIRFNLESYPHAPKLIDLLNGKDIVLDGVDVMFVFVLPRQNKVLDTVREN